jgi:soluble lytic murein transglycosylase-like protein
MFKKLGFKLLYTIRLLTVGTCLVFCLALIPTLLKYDNKALIYSVLKLGEEKANVQDAIASEAPESFQLLGKLDKEKQNYIKARSRDAGINPALMLAIAQQETRGDPYLGSYAGAIGLMQVTPSSAKLYCGDFVKKAEMLWDWRINVDCAVEIFRTELKEAKGDVFKALYAYNGSPSCKENCSYQSCRQDKYGAKNCTVVCVNQCSQTYEYARAVIKHINDL